VLAGIEAKEVVCDKTTTTDACTLVNRETQTDIVDNLFDFEREDTNMEDEPTVYETPFLSFRTCHSSSNEFLNCPPAASSYKMHTTISDQEDENSLDVSFDLNDDFLFNAADLTTIIQPVDSRNFSSNYDAKTSLFAKR
jgi:hypothetical protein